MRITLDPLPATDPLLPPANVILDLQERAFEERFFALRFTYADGTFIYSEEPLQVIAEDLVEEIIKLLKKRDHEFCVAGYPIVNVKIDENEFVSFYTADDVPLRCSEKVTVTKIAGNLADLLKSVLIISSPQRTSFIS